MTMSDSQKYEKFDVTCICCPTGCAITVERTSQTEAVYISGAGCARGKAYAPAEVLHPERVVTTTVCVSGVSEPLSVRTSAPVPRERVQEVVRAIKRVGAELILPIAIGDVVLADVCGTGADVVATKHLG